MNHEQTFVPAVGHDEARRHLTTQVLGARNLEDVLAATQALKEWIQTYPEEREWMRDGFEQLSHMEDIARERAALPAPQQEMYHRRDCLMSQIYSAYTLPDVAVARKALEEWLASYPKDDEAEAATHYLTTMQEMLMSIAEQEAVASLQPAA